MSTNESRASSPRKKPEEKASKEAVTSIRKVTEHTSMLRSKIAVTRLLVTHLETHYQGAAGDEPEDFIMRDDYATVPPAHIDEYLAVLHQLQESWEDELEQWESMTVSAPSTVLRGDSE